jgi:two-component system phosphate regulon sensor histidine kinase PhoR
VPFVIRTVTGRLLVAFALGAAALLAALALYLGAADRASRLAELRAELALDARVLAAETPARAIAARDLRAVDAWANREGALFDRRVTVIGADGAVLGDSQVGRDSLRGLENHASRPEVVEARATGEGSDVRRSASVGEEFLYFARALPSPRGAVVRVALPFSRARAHVRDGLRALWIAAAFALLAAIAIATWRTRPLARRLRAFEQAAHRIAAGDLEARAPEEGRDEIGEAGRVLNRMASGLRTTLGRVEAERDMREQMLSAMTDGVVLLDAQGAIVHANAALGRALARPAAPVPGEPFTARCRVAELEAFLAEARTRRGVLRREFRLRGPAERALEAVASRLADGSLLVVVRDLTPLRHLERVRQDFVANVSHELKTPLTSILGYAETLLDGGLEDAGRRREFVETIREQGVRLRAIVNDLLVLAELERPDAALALAAVDLVALAHSVTTALEPRARRDGLALTCAATDEPVTVLGDRGRLEQLLFNLVDNGLKYTERGSVRVEVGRAEGGLARLAVEDTGPGIPEDATSRIFERFYRVDAARSSEIPGTGLGLSIVRHIVELHGGRIEASNRSEGGARFVVHLPLLR